MQRRTKGGRPFRQWLEYVINHGMYQRTTLPANLCLLCALLSLVPPAARADSQPYVAPSSPRVRYSFDRGWKFLREDAAGAQAPDFDDATWADVTTPHTYNDTDTFNRIISHGGGQEGAYRRPMDSRTSSRSSDKAEFKTGRTA